MSVKIEAHYAPEKLQCPECNKIGYINYSDYATGEGAAPYHCANCDTSYRYDEMPVYVEVGSEEEVVVKNDRSYKKV